MTIGKESLRCCGVDLTVRQPQLPACQRQGRLPVLQLDGGLHRCTGHLPEPQASQDWLAVPEGSGGISARAAGSVDAFQVRVIPQMVHSDWHVRQHSSKEGHGRKHGRCPTSNALFPGTPYPAKPPVLLQPDAVMALRFIDPFIDPDWHYTACSSLSFLFPFIEACKQEHNSTPATISLTLASPEKTPLTPFIWVNEQPVQVLPWLAS